MIRRPPRSTQSRSSAASDVYKRQGIYIFTSEVIATLGLIIIIFGSMKSGKIAVAASVGLYITAGYWFTSSTSFANPAVAIARTFTAVSYTHLTLPTIYSV